MGSEWKEVPLADLYDFRSGLSKPRSEFGFGCGFLSFKDVFYNYFVPHKLSELVNSTKKERADCSILRGDVFLTRTSETMDELGMSCVALRDYENATFNGFTKRLRPKHDSEVVPEYAAYFFRSPKFRSELTSMSSLSTRASLNNEMLGRLKITLPGAVEQTAIGGILKSLDDKIELNRKMNETLEAMARVIFKPWFVDFDPVRAKAEGRQPIGMDAETAALFPDSFEDSELGEIPKGWRPGKIEDIVSLAKTSIKPASMPTETFEHFSIPAFDEGRVPKKESGCSIKSNKYSVPTNAVLISKLNPRIQRVWLPSVSESHKSICSTEFLVSVPLDGVSREFVYSLYTSHAFQQSFAALVTGTSGSHQRVKPEFLLDMDIVVPSKESMKCFGEQSKPLLDRVAVNIAESQTLAQLRDALLPKLLSGDIRVKDADHSVRRVV